MRRTPAVASNPDRKAHQYPCRPFPGRSFRTALATSGDGTVIWGIGNAGTGTQIIYQFHALTNNLCGFPYISTPPMLPRVSVSKDGSYAMVAGS